MKIKTAIYVGNYCLEEVDVHKTNKNEPSAKYHVYSSKYSSIDNSPNADLVVRKRTLSNGDKENYADLPTSKNTYHQSKVVSLDCNKLVVSQGKIVSLHHNHEESSLTLVVKNNGTVRLAGGNSVIIESEANDSLKITLVTPAFQGSTIKDTDRLLEFAQSVLNLHADLQNIKCEDYDLGRQVKKINNIPNTLEVNPYKLTLHSQELKNKAHEIEREVNEKFYKFYSICKDIESTPLGELTTDIMGQIESYLQDGDVIL